MDHLIPWRFRGTAPPFNRSPTCGLTRLGDQDLYPPPIYAPQTPYATRCCLDSFHRIVFVGNIHINILLLSRVLRCALRSQTRSIGIMASPDVFLSSPPRGSRRHVNMLPTSSPVLPSVQDILSQKPKRPAIKSGSKAIPIPDDANPTFTSARELWKSAKSAEFNQSSPSSAANKIILLDDIDSPAPTPEHDPKTESPPRKLSRKKTRPDQPKIKEKEPAPVEEEGASTQPWRKYKSTTPEKDNSPRRVSTETNSLNIASKQDVVKGMNRETTPSPDAQLPKPCEATKSNAEEPLFLEPAMVRRKNWTPPAKKAAIILDSDISATGEDLGVVDEDEPAKSFCSIISAYKCDEAAGTEATACPSDESATKKRKLGVQRDESTTIPKINPKPPKSKAPRKKPRTITDLATAAYRQVDQTEPTDGMQDTAAPEKPSAPSEKGGKTKPRKRSSKAAAKKKAQPPKPVLFSPETALKQVAKQDFVFGTSSQLAMEQSPTFLRELQRAMINSNQLEYVDFTTPLNSDGIEAPETRPRLWDAAARNADGDLFDVEVIDLAETCPRPSQTPGDVDPFGYFKGDDAPTLPVDAKLPGLSVGSPKDDDSFVDLEDILAAAGTNQGHTAAKNSQLFTTKSPKMQQTQSALVDAEPQSSQALQDADQLNTTNGKSPVNGDALDIPQRPTFELYTDAQLSKEVSHYGFKPIKRRSAMLALLDQCWQQKGNASQQVRMKSTSAAVTSPVKRARGRPRKNSAEGSQVQDPPPSAQAPETPKRPRGRPRKASQTTPTKQAADKRTSTPTRKKTRKTIVTPKRVKAAKVIEIPDSESELTDTLDSAPNSSPSSTFSSPQKLDLTMSVSEDTELSLTMTPTDTQTHLFTCITQAVTTAPRTTDTTNPSWHEKILLYDPIVLEDLASWLNSGQLSRIGYDEEVNPGELKKWCESKSICCLWKVNLRGKERKRY